MNTVEIREFTKLLRECEDLRHENVNLRIELKDIKADIAKYELKKMLSNPIEESFVVSMKEGDES